MADRSISRRTLLRGLLAAAVVATVPRASETAAAIQSNTLWEQTILTFLAIAQPTSVHGLEQLLSELSTQFETPPVLNRLAGNLRNLIARGRVLEVRTTPTPLYALTEQGQLSLPTERRYFRDRARLFLLKGDHPHPDRTLDTSEFRTVDGSSAANMRLRLQAGARTLAGSNTADAMSGPRRRMSKALLPYLSFANREQITEALGEQELPQRVPFRAVVLCLGLSRELMDWFIRNPHRSYRQFTIPKRNGGTRPIECPRTFLKITQRLLLDLFLGDLCVHHAVHSFVAGKSHITNAIVHERQAFVGGIDIRNFFGSITRGMTTKCLVLNGFDQECAENIAGICTRYGVLPQGAPTSPALSNALLFPFDVSMAAYCAGRNLRYTRYCDDVAVSGDDRSAVASALAQAGVELRARYDFSLSRSKSRIVSHNRQQRVTGAVINVSAAPPRATRRRLRARFHQASLSSNKLAGDANRLRGHVSYLQAFPSMRNCRDVREYRAVLTKYETSLA